MLLLQDVKPRVTVAGWTAGSKGAAHVSCCPSCRDPHQPQQTFLSLPRWMNYLLSLLLATLNARLPSIFPSQRGSEQAFHTHNLSLSQLIWMAALNAKIWVLVAGSTPPAPQQSCWGMLHRASPVLSITAAVISAKLLRTAGNHMLKCHPACSWQASYKLEGVNAVPCIAIQSLLAQAGRFVWCFRVTRQKIDNVCFNY